VRLNPVPTLTIGGRGVSTESTFTVVNPATGEVFAEAPDCSREQLDLAMESAQAAFGDWRLDEAGRAELMHRAADAVEKRIEEIARIQTLEQGKPLRDSVHGMNKSVRRFHHYADLEIPVVTTQDDGDALVQLVRRPLGVIAVIKPWNSPATNVLNALGPALRAGNTAVFKPSPYTPLSALLIGEAIREVLPPGVVNVVSGLDPLGQWVAEHPIPRGVGFTGSSESGRKVNQSAAGHLKRVLLELGGNDAAIVLDDVDVDEVAGKLVKIAFANTGQVCMAIKRVYAMQPVFDLLASALAKKVGELTVGDGLTEDPNLGPLSNKMQYDRVRELVNDALANGAAALTGGHAIDRPGYFFEPTVLTNVSEGMRVVDEEQFGPVLPVMKFTTVDEAVARANATPYGLGGSVWSADPARARQVAERLECGTAWVNTHMQSNDRSPFGGVKGSGLGTQNGLYTIYAFTDNQTVWTSRSGNVSH
jgi:acyl-CoA reductase-like NAD-dependent aldehyde dehydrogenase